MVLREGMIWDRPGPVSLAALGVLSAWQVLHTAAAQTPAAMEARAAQLQQQPVSYQTSLEQYEALRHEAQARPGRSKAATDWTGVWTRVDTAVAQHARLPLRPAYAARFAQTQDRARKGRDFDFLTFCLPAGYPRSNNEPFLKEIIVRPEQTWVIDEQVSETRRIYTDGRGHPPADDSFPLWEGHSIGFWDGGTLVVHSNSVKAFPSGYARNGPPQSEQLSTVEQWRSVNPDLIEMIMTVYDRVVLTRPYQIVYQYMRLKDPAPRMDMWACEDRNTVQTPDGGTRTILPGEPGYKAPGIEGRLQEPQDSTTAP